MIDRISLASIGEEEGMQGSHNRMVKVSVGAR
jgi:hypothetical protein